MSENEIDLSRDDGTLLEREFWGISRHEAIAGAASRFLAPNAQAQIERILAPMNQLMADLGGWADRVKNRTSPRPTDDPDTVAFVTDPRNRNNGPWHYVNLPLNAVGYSREQYPSFTRDTDVVQMIGECVRALQGTSDRFTELNALRLLAHLVGDVHQPVHVGCCYIDKSRSVPKLVRSPEVALAKTLKSDRGGNSLYLPVTPSGVSLHAYWDSKLDSAGGGGGDDGHDHDHDPLDDESGIELDADEPVEDEYVDPVLRELFISKLAGTVERNLRARSNTGEADEPTVLPLDQWAVLWANRSLHLARSAYRSLKITGQRGNNPNVFRVSWHGQEKYDARCKPIVTRQLALAAENLAALLNAIWHDQ